MNEDGQYANEQEMLKHLNELNSKTKQRKDYSRVWENFIAKANLKDALEERMDVIGQNGNDGLHYESLNHKVPSHYDFEITPLEYMESLFSEEGYCGFLEGNVIKYISRWRDKNGQQDLEKAKVYLEKLIDFVAYEGD